MSAARFGVLKNYRCSTNEEHILPRETKRQISQRDRNFAKRRSLWRKLKTEKWQMELEFFRTFSFIHRGSFSRWPTFNCVSFTENFCLQSQCQGHYLIFFSPILGSLSVLSFPLSCCIIIRESFLSLCVLAADSCRLCWSFVNWSEPSLSTASLYEVSLPLSGPEVLCTAFLSSPQRWRPQKSIYYPLKEKKLKHNTLWCHKGSEWQQTIDSDEPRL